MSGSLDSRAEIAQVNSSQLGPPVFREISSGNGSRFLPYISRQRVGTERCSRLAVVRGRAGSVYKELGQVKRVIVLFGAWIVFGMTAGAFAQGVQTGTIRGVVRDAQDLAVPGVTVTVTSPALQGPRSVVTDSQGLYSIPALPAGTYTVKFELSGFQTIERETTVALGLTVDQNVSIRPAGVSETVQVVGETPAPIATPVVGANLKHEEIEALATPRTIQGIATLAPALTTNSPNRTQVVINGGFAYDNVFMINGVDVNDNLFAQPQNLFVEDAIEETQVLTSGISAEYGRFTGGVI